MASYSFFEAVRRNIDFSLFLVILRGMNGVGEGIGGEMRGEGRRRK